MIIIPRYMPPEVEIPYDVPKTGSAKATPTGAFSSFFSSFFRGDEERPSISFSKDSSPPVWCAHDPSELNVSQIRAIDWDGHSEDPMTPRDHDQYIQAAASRTPPVPKIGGAMPAPTPGSAFTGGPAQKPRQRDMGNGTTAGAVGSPRPGPPGGSSVAARGGHHLPHTGLHHLGLKMPGLHMPGHHSKSSVASGGGAAGSPRSGTGTPQPPTATNLAALNARTGPPPPAPPPQPTLTPVPGSVRAKAQPVPENGPIQQPVPENGGHVVVHEDGAR